MNSIAPFYYWHGLTSEEPALHLLLDLIEAYHGHNPGGPAVYSQLPTTLEFYKQVSKGLPCVYPVADLIKPFKASRWTRNYLTEAVTDTLEVAVTPNGKADSLYEVAGKGSKKAFLQPAKIYITLKEFFEELDALKSNDAGPVYYLQSQNGNLRNTPLKLLLKDLPENFDFAKEVLGEPDAANIWIGDERSVTTIHSDPYENLYVVLRGTKIFTLWAPVDEVTLERRPSPYQLSRSTEFDTLIGGGRPVNFSVLGTVHALRQFEYGQFEFDRNQKKFSFELQKNENGGDPPRVRWVDIDPTLPLDKIVNKCPLYRYAQPHKVVVEAGQMLYLPGGWYHYVEQKSGTWDDGTKSPCISVNYWYDMEYEGEKYVMRQLGNRLAERVRDASEAFRFHTSINQEKNLHR